MSTKHRGPEREKIALDFFIKLMRAAESVRQASNLLIRSFDLTPGQFGVLETIYHLGPICQKEMAGKLLYSEGNVTQLIDSLRKKGFVERVQRSDDRRYFDIALTQKGREKISSVFPEYARGMTKVHAGLTESEQIKAASYLRKLGISLSTEQQVLSQRKIKE